ncbi:response regulator transcription factor [Paenibacillus sp.]|jgi:DNA-binding response OmpR family regulator|uniref:response regulator transcription factor n=1 Tax=Paenibacillus sp. TaxID=58172 RepID=UPI0028231C8A|nr:response regulator transcription factor [Paenibacillus sp.]MDR0267155.1 response regulator transcription factor [Paenibacillus sp.]
MDQVKILIIEDDAKIASLLKAHIEKYGYTASAVADFAHVMDEFSEVQPHLVLLDVNLPMFDGFYWCRQIRALSTCPILFISARESEMDQVMALENGADDYITKPFHYDVVVAKIRSHLRRAYGSYSAKTEERTVETSGLVLYPERFVLTYGGLSVELTQKEAMLVEALMKKSDRIVSRGRLLDLMWEDRHFIDDNTLNVYITRIRKKLKELGFEDPVETVRGAGYKLKLKGNEGP